MRSALRWRGCAGLLWATLLAVSPTVTFAQKPTDYRHTVWSTEGGLPQSSVPAVLQTRDGFLWMATEGGAVRFDGLDLHVVRHETQPAFLSDDISSLVEDAQGALWFGTADGTVVLRQGRFEHRGTEAGLPAGPVTALAMDGGSLVALCGGVLYRGFLTDGTDRFSPVSGIAARIVDVRSARSGGVWVVAETGTFRLKDGKADPLPAALAGVLPGFAQVAEGAGDTLWARSRDAVAVLSGSRLHRWRTGAELPAGRIDSVSVDREGTAWVGMNNGLVLLRAEADGPQLLPAQTVAALAENDVLTTFEDREGNHWIGTDASGLHALRQSKFQARPELGEQTFTAVIESGNTTWVGTRDGGLRRVRRGGVGEPVGVGKLTSPRILALAPAPDGGVWAGTPDGLNRVDAQGHVRTYTAAGGLPDDFVRSLVSDADRSVWAGTRRGLVHVTDGRTDTLTAADGLAGDLIGTLLRTRASATAPAGLWIGTSGGLSFRSPEGRLTSFGPKEGLPELLVAALAQDGAGTLWVATSHGALSRFDGHGFEVVPGVRAASEVLGMAADGEGFLWLREVRGVERVAVASLARCMAGENVCDPAIARFGTADGLPSDEAVPGGSPALWMSATGDLLFATRRGLAVAEPVHFPMNALSPPVVLERFLVDDVPADLFGAALALPYGGHRYTFDYAGLSFTVPAEVRYRYQLEGFDREPTDAGARRSATYTNLPPGNYSFHVQARNNDGVWNTVGARLPFRIVPPFYRRVWFGFLVVLGLAGLGTGLYQLRLRRLRTQFSAVLGERNRIAREIHDTLAQGYVGLSLQLDLAASLLKVAKPEAALAQIRQARTLVTEGLADARQSIWELRANASADSLPTRLRVAVERAESPTTAVRSVIGGAYRALAPAVEAEVLRIASEALANVVRHAAATEAFMELRYGTDTLELLVRDNGRGFRVGEQPVGHYGIAGMGERAAVLGAKLLVESEPGKGTAVRLILPIGRAKE